MRFFCASRIAWITTRLGNLYRVGETLKADYVTPSLDLFHIRNSLGSKGYWSTPYTVHYPPCVFVGSTFASHISMVVLITIVSPTAIETLNRITDLLNGFVSSPKLYSAFPHFYAYLLYYYSHALIKELFGWTILFSFNMHCELPSALCSFSASQICFHILTGTFRSAKSHYSSNSIAQSGFLGVFRINSAYIMDSCSSLYCNVVAWPLQQDLALLAVHFRASFFYSQGIQLRIPQP